VRLTHINKRLLTYLITVSSLQIKEDDGECDNHDNDRHHVKELKKHDVQLKNKVKAET